MRALSRLTRRQALRLGSTALAGAALVDVAGCGSSGGSRRGDTLTMWSWSGADVLHAGFHAVQQAYPAEFKNVKLSTQIMAGGDQSVAQQLTLQLAAHEPLPDIVMLDYLEVPELAAAGVLADLSSILDPVADDLYAGAHAVTSYRGRKVAAPYELKSKLFYYREDLFAKAGIDVAAIRTTDDLIQAGHRFRAKFPKQHMMGVSPALDTSQAGEVMSAFPDPSFADPSGHYHVTRNPCFRQTLDFEKQLLKANIGYVVAGFTAGWPPAIKNGSICSFLTAQWMKVYLPQYAGAEQVHRWNAVLWPRLDPLPDQRYGSDDGGAVWVVPDGAPNRELAISYLRRALLDRTGAIALFQQTGQLPLLRSARSAALDVLRSTRKPAGMSQADWLQSPQHFFRPDYFETEFNSYDFVRAFTFDPNAINETSIFAAAVGDAYNGSTSIEKALKSAEDAMRNQIGNPYLA